VRPAHEYLRADDFARSVDDSLKALQVDYVDLLMVHWRNPEMATPPLFISSSAGTSRLVNWGNVWI
jgi:aryl-alcohol dehydrogenase-like predicted oxidoreductase